MTTAAKPTVQTRLSAAEAEAKYGKQVGQVWDEGLQEFIALGQALAIEQMDKPADLTKNLQAFEANRKKVLAFIHSEYFVEAKYDEKGNPISGQLGDYYQVPGGEQKALTKSGSSKIKQLFRWFRGAARHVTGVESKEYCSATIEVPIVDHYGRVVGAGVGSCSTAEKAFTSKAAINKYGGWCEWNKETRELDIKRPPDYRAALHDVTSKATKRADTQATIVAAALEEIFTVARADEGDKTEDKEVAVYPGQPAAAPFRFPKKISTPEFKHLAGKLIADASVSDDDLTKLAAWCRTVKTSNPEAIARLLSAAEEEHERRRSDENEELGL